MKNYVGCWEWIFLFELRKNSLQVFITRYTFRSLWIKQKQSLWEKIQFSLCWLFRPLNYLQDFKRLKKLGLFRWKVQGTVVLCRDNNKGKMKLYSLDMKRGRSTFLSSTIKIRNLVFFSSYKVENSHEKPVVWVES